MPRLFPGGLVMKAALLQGGLVLAMLCAGCTTSGSGGIVLFPLPYKLLEETKGLKGAHQNPVVWPRETQQERHWTGGRRTRRSVVGGGGRSRDAGAVRGRTADSHRRNDRPRQVWSRRRRLQDAERNRSDRQCAVEIQRRPRSGGDGAIRAGAGKQARLRAGRRRDAGVVSDQRK